MEDTASFKEMLWIDYDAFLNLLAAIEPFISPQESYHGVPTIKANERLTLTLRFLATGETFRSLDFSFEYRVQLFPILLSLFVELWLIILEIYT